MKVLLVNPPLLLDESRHLPRRPSYPFEHLGLGYLAAVLRAKGYQAVIKDAYLSRRGISEFFSELKAENPDLIGFSATHGFMTSALALIEHFRKAGFSGHITLGGYLPTFLAQELLLMFPQVDSVVRGEGEYTLLELVEKLKKGGKLEEISGLTFRKGNEIISNPPRDLIYPLEKLPFPARDTLPLLLKSQDYASLCSSRGCYGKCSFCSIHSFYGSAKGPKWRGRAAEKVADELEKLATDWNLSKFAFPDDNFIGAGKRGKSRAFAIGKELLKRGLKIRFSVLCRACEVDSALFAFLKAAGMGTVFVGFESGTERALKSYNKMISLEENKQAARIIKNLGIKCYPGFIMFDPDTTLEEVTENLKFTAELESGGELIEIDDLFNSLQPFIGTPVYRKLKREGRLYQKTSNLLAYDLLPAYHIIDERVELLREGARDLRKKLKKVAYLNFARLGQEFPQLEEKVNLQYLQFKKLTRKISALEREFLNTGVLLFKKEPLNPAAKKAGRLSDQLAAEVNPQIEKYNQGVEKLLKTPEMKAKYLYLA